MCGRWPTSCARYDFPLSCSTKSLQEDAQVSLFDNSSTNVPSRSWLNGSATNLLLLSGDIGLAAGLLPRPSRGVGLCTGRVAAVGSGCWFGSLAPTIPCGEVASGARCAYGRRSVDGLSVAWSMLKGWRGVLGTRTGLGSAIPTECPTTRFGRTSSDGRRGRQLLAGTPQASKSA